MHVAMDAKRTSAQVKQLLKEKDFILQGALGSYFLSI
jgi:hypothetical protein